MYIVLTAMLALNVSSDVLEGFKQVEDGLGLSAHNAAIQNETIYDEIATIYANNPAKSGASYRQAMEVKLSTDSLYQLVDSLKLAIVRKADGKNADTNNIRRKDDLEAASFVMLSPTQQQGKRLRLAIDNYRARVEEVVADSATVEMLSQYLSTKVNDNDMLEGRNWEMTLFESMPVAAAVTLLTKIQNDIRYTEGVMAQQLLTKIDQGDVRVNQLNAFVLPNSKNVIRGGRYSANIVLAAIDSTQQPTIYIGGKPLESREQGLYEVQCSRSGTYNYEGYLEVPRGDGTVENHPFTSSYTVVDPSATVSATLMNVLYAGIENPISISVPGVASNNVSASMTNGTLTRKGDGWVAKPTKVGSEAAISVTAVVDGVSQVVSNSVFRVRQLPDPMPFISYKDANGNSQRYRGGKPLTKAILLSAKSLEAAIDDNLLNVTYRVLSFETIFFDSMGNAMPEISAGANFSERQMSAIRRLARGKRFYISRVRAIGPDGVERDLSPIEVIVG